MSAMVLTTAATGIASAQNACGSSITMCGCTITSPGTYTIGADLTAAQGLTSRNGCIDIAAEKVMLITEGHQVTGAGTGTGIGIHLLSSADNVFLEGGGTDGAGVSTSFTTLKGWRYGLESDARDVVSDFFNYDENVTGVFLRGARNNNINDFGASSNTVYGVWIKGGSGNQINCSNATNNGVAGTYLGCSSTGPSGRACKEDEATSNGNLIYDHGSTNFGTGAQSYGIAVERGSKRNTLMDLFTTGNTVDDLFDGNPNCDKNLWQVNTFKTTNQSCIH